MKRNPVVHFEFPYENKERISKFYSKTFGWGMQDMGDKMGNYVVAHTAETDKEGMIKKPGAINGGFFKKNEKSNRVSVVIAVDDINESIKKVRENGGKVDGEPSEIPNIGSYASFTDTEGNKIAMLQPSSSM